MGYNLSNLLYLITIVTFILALRFLSSPAHARRGNQIGAAGMLVAIAVTFAQKRADRATGRSRVGMVIGGGFGAFAARRVKMTAMPQMVALFNGVGGGAAALVSLAELHRILPEPGAPKVDICACDRALGADRLDLVRRLDDRVREAAGADRRTADHVRRPAVRERGALPRLRRCGDRARRGRRRTNGCCGRSSAAPRSSASSSCCRSAAPTCRS